MKIDRLEVGLLKSNCYIVTVGDNSIIIDPGDEPDKILDACKGKNIKEIIVTHHHFDHIGALKELEDYFDLKENKKTNIFDYEVINTPGHTSDSVTFYFPKEKVMFTGDFIFKGNIGRFDLPTGSIFDMKNSLNLICNYSSDIVLYPGHGPKTLLDIEKNNFKYYF